MCRRCGWQGDGIQFVRDMSGLSYADACRTMGTTPRDNPGHLSRHVPSVWEPKPSVLPSGQWMAAAEEFVARASEAMAKCEEGQAYAKGRGLTASTIKALRVGWCTGDTYQDREAWGLAPEINPKTGKPKRVWLPSGLVLPTMRDGKVVALKIRRNAWTPEDLLPKYAWVSGGHSAPMILAPGRGKPVVVVESELDAILVAQEARDIVTAIAMRTAKGKPDTNAHVWLMSGLVLVALDHDQAGADAARWWKERYRESKRWPVPAGKDVGDLAATPGLVRAWVEAGLPEPEPVAEEPKRLIVRAEALAHGDPCPHGPDDLERFSASHPNLICCPATRPSPWWWRDRSWCPKCKTPCSVGVTHE